MKNLNLTTILTLTLLTSLTVGCAKEKKAPAPNVAPSVVVPVGPYVPPVPNVPGSIYGATAALTIEGATDAERAQRASLYIKHGVNNPTNAHVNLDLKKYGTSYGGNISISMYDGNQQYLDYFTGGNTAAASVYNVFFTSNGKKVFHGFFEDFYGGAIVVIDQFVDLGDGQGTQDAVGGSIWFKNFGPIAIDPYTGRPQDHHPETYCWFVGIGPYDCRAWKSGDGVNTTAAVHPDNGYIKLGTFTNLSLKKAFNDNL